MDYNNYIIINLYSIIIGVFGHLGLGFAIKRFTPQIPLWILLTSTMLIDILSLTFFIFTPLWTTHGLFMSVNWSVLALFTTIFIAKYLNTKRAHTNAIVIFKNSTVI